MIEMPKSYANIKTDERLRAVLELWLKLYATDPRLKDFTHVRASFDINQQKVGAVVWSLLEADDDAIYRTHEIHLGKGGTEVVTGLLGDYIIVGDGIDHGQMTFRFDPPAVSLDLLNRENTSLFAEYLIDVRQEQQLQDAIFTNLTKH